MSTSYDWKTYTLECNCLSPEHILRFYFDPDDKWISMTYHLYMPDSFFKRVWYAIKYIFGHRRHFGYFSDTLLMADDIKKFKEYIDACYVVLENPTPRMPIHGEKVAK
ncbi:MAG: hypothetical protein WC444_04225 [Candidatus Paceibacterota bacterium]